MSEIKIKKGDKVVVLSGKDKGRHGEVVKALPAIGKVVLSGVNVVTRHKKPTQVNPQGGLERSEAPIAVCKVAIQDRSEEHTSELQSLMRISYAVFCLKKKTKTTENTYKSLKNKK